MCVCARTCSCVCASVCVTKMQIGKKDMNSKGGVVWGKAQEEPEGEEKGVADMQI